jgi:hypothetical protein
MQPPPHYPPPPPPPGGYGQPWPPYPPYPPPPPPRPFLSRLGRPLKLLLGALSLWPIVYFVVFVVFFIADFFSTFADISSGHQSPDTSRFFANFQTFFILQWVTILFTYGLIALYVVDVFRTERLARDRRVLWLVVLLVGSFIAMPVYWYLYVWRDPDPPPPWPPAGSPYGG